MGDPNNPPLNQGSGPPQGHSGFAGKSFIPDYMMDMTGSFAMPAQGAYGEYKLPGRDDAMGRNQKAAQQQQQLQQQSLGAAAAATAPLDFGNPFWAAPGSLPSIPAPFDASPMDPFGRSGSRLYPGSRYAAPGGPMPAAAGFNGKPPGPMGELVTPTNPADFTHGGAFAPPPHLPPHPPGSNDGSVMMPPPGHGHGPLVPGRPAAGSFIDAPGMLPPGVPGDLAADKDGHVHHHHHHHHHYPEAGLDKQPDHSRAPDAFGGPMAGGFYNPLLAAPGAPGAPVAAGGVPRSNSQSEVSSTAHQQSLQYWAPAPSTPLDEYGLLPTSLHSLLPEAPKSAAPGPDPSSPPKDPSSPSSPPPTTAESVSSHGSGSHHSAAAAAAAAMAAAAAARAAGRYAAAASSTAAAAGPGSANSGAGAGAAGGAANNGPGPQGGRSSRPPSQGGPVPPSSSSNHGPGGPRSFAAAAAAAPTRPPAPGKPGVPIAGSGPRPGASILGTPEPREALLGTPDMTAGPRRASGSVHSGSARGSSARDLSPDDGRDLSPEGDGERNPAALFDRIQRRFAQGHKPRLNSLHDLLLRCKTVSDVNLAFQALARYRANYIATSDETATLLVKACCNVGVPERALDAIQHQRELSLWPTRKALHFLMVSFAVQRSIDGVFAAYDALKVNGFQPTPHSYHVLIRACVDAGDIDRALEVLQMCKEAKVAIKRGTYNVLMNGCRTHSRSEELIHIRKMMEEDGVEQNVSSMKLAVEGYIQMHDNAQTLKSFSELVSSTDDIPEETAVHVLEAFSGKEPETTAPMPPPRSGATPLENALAGLKVVEEAEDNIVPSDSASNDSSKAKKRAAGTAAPAETTQPRRVDLPRLREAIRILEQANGTGKVLTSTTRAALTAARAVAQA